MEIKKGDIMSNKKNVIARVGNFEITKDGNAEHDYIRIRAVGGSWSVSHRDDSPMYGLWLAMCKDPEYTKGMEVRIIMEYMMSQMLYDEGFIRDWWEAIGKFNERKITAVPETNEKEESDAIAEVQMMEEVKKNLEA